MVSAMFRQPRLPILLAPNAGAFAIEPCPAAESAPVTHAAGHHHAKHDPSHKAQHDGDCAFSPLLTGFTPSDLPAQLPAPSVAADAPIAPTAAPAFKTGPPALPPPATGPPALA
jgi:hypothetical protein